MSSTNRDIKLQADITAEKIIKDLISRESKFLYLKKAVYHLIVHMKICGL